MIRTLLALPACMILACASFEPERAVKVTAVAACEGDIPNGRVFSLRNGNVQEPEGAESRHMFARTGDWVVGCIDRWCSAEPVSRFSNQVSIHIATPPFPIEMVVPQREGYVLIWGRDACSGEPIRAIRIIGLAGGKRDTLVAQSSDDHIWVHRARLADYWGFLTCAAGYNCQLTERPAVESLWSESEVYLARK